MITILGLNGLVWATINLGMGLLLVSEIGHGDRSSSEDTTFVTFLGSQLYHGAVDARCLSLLQVELSGTWVGHN